MSTDQNVNAAGQPTWEFYSHPGFCKVTDYATYQAQTFKYCLKGEYMYIYEYTNPFVGKIYRLAQVDYN